jgi:hypothetical protein
MSTNNNSGAKKKVLSTFFAIVVVAAGSIGAWQAGLFDNGLNEGSPTPIIVEGNHTLNNTYIVAASEDVTFQNGTFTFANETDYIEVNGTFLGNNITLEGDIKVYESGIVKIINSPHTVDEIYAYNTSQVIITDSMVKKINIYDKATVTVNYQTFSGTGNYSNVIYGDVMTLIEDLNSSLLALELKVNNLSSDGGEGTTGDITSLQDTITELNATIQLLKSNMGVLNSTMFLINTTLSGDISTLQANIATLQNDLNTLVGRVDAIEAISPLVGILDPDFEEIISGNVTVRAMIWAAAGYTVEILINGSVNATTLPWTWNTTKLSDGWWNLTIRVTGINANVGQDEILVFVGNQEKLTGSQTLSWSQSTGSSSYVDTGLSIDVTFYETRSIYCEFTAHSKVSAAGRFLSFQFQVNGSNSWGHVYNYNLVSIPISVSHLYVDFEPGSYQITVQVKVSAPTGYYDNPSLSVICQ